MSTPSAVAEKESIEGSHLPARRQNHEDVPIDRRKVGSSSFKEKRSNTAVTDESTGQGTVKKLGHEVWSFLARETNFYRIHVIVFTITPLIFSAIFYASNTTTIAYIDCLFLCVSAMSLTGLATINISTTTAWQQAILFFLMAIGNLSAVSILMVLIRRHFFQVKFNDVIRSSRKTRKRLEDVEENNQREKKRLECNKRQNEEKEQSSNDSESPRQSSSSKYQVEQQEDDSKKRNWFKWKSQKGPLRADMVRRIDQPAVLISGNIPTRLGLEENQITEEPTGILAKSVDKDEVQPLSNEMESSAGRGELQRARFRDDSNISSGRIGSSHVRSTSGEVSNNSSRPRGDSFLRTNTVEFAESSMKRERKGRDRSRNINLKQISRTLEVERVPTSQSISTNARERGFGGFPTPFAIAGQVVQRAFPKIQEEIERTTTMPRVATFASTHSVGASSAYPRTTSLSAPYLTFDVTVSRNSHFHELTEDQREELGGAEYRALNLLAKLLPTYWLLWNFFFIVMVAPWLASRSAAVQVHDVLASQGVNAPSTTWMWFFQVVSAYSNTGLSLIDTNMTELPTQYFMLIPIAILILAGNTAFPILLRLFIWSLSKLVSIDGRMYETLRFLLDHPRRCFVYLFPSSQTWFLLVVLVLLNSTDWIFYEILDIGNSAIDSTSAGQRTFSGLFQAIAVRTAGFQVISLLAIAPAVQILYVIMMYISAYPIAMSVRNTNVYEERSLEVYQELEVASLKEPQVGGAKVWGHYLAAHARKQMAFDMWWLGFALWLLCIMERHSIQDSSTDQWFTVFNCLFELVSAYGTVGLSTGSPNDDFSLSGNFTTLGKLVVIAVMIRGRHRGLPVAIDRAVLLPIELESQDKSQDGQEYVQNYTLASSNSGKLHPQSAPQEYDASNNFEPAKEK